MRAVTPETSVLTSVENLRLNYFAVDRRDRIWRISAKSFEDIWRDSADTADLQSDGEAVELDSRLRVLTVLSDANWCPLVTFLLRGTLRDGRLLTADRYRLYRTLSGHRQTELEGRLIREQLSGWPADWQSQLAVAMDTPVGAFGKVSIGGPLVMADLWDMSVGSVLQHFEGTLRN